MPCSRGLYAPRPARIAHPARSLPLTPAALTPFSYRLISTLTNNWSSPRHSPPPTPNPLTFVQFISLAIWPVTFPCIIAIAYAHAALKSLAITLDDPFGIDLIDFDVETFLQTVRSSRSWLTAALANGTGVGEWHDL